MVRMWTFLGFTMQVPGRPFSVGGSGAELSQSKALREEGLQPAGPGPLELGLCPSFCEFQRPGSMTTGGQASGCCRCRSDGRWLSESLLRVMKM